jgi:phosphoheptose isomerase
VADYLHQINWACAACLFSNILGECFLTSLLAGRIIIELVDLHSILTGDWLIQCYVVEPAIYAKVNGGVYKNAEHCCKQLLYQYMKSNMSYAAWSVVTYSGKVFTSF